MQEHRLKLSGTRACLHAVGVAALAVLALVAAGGNALADDDFFRSSPGALSQSHAAIDSQERCNDCHTNGRGLSNDKCLDCHDHTDLKERIDAGKGFHASAKVRGRQCEACHLEHKGRNYDMMGWRAVGGMESFDHKLTGWPLSGKHAAIDCTECHKRTNRQGLRVFMGEDRLCGSCHQDDQPHGFTKKALMACDRCHNESVWKPAKRNQDFDHDNPNDAAMRLDGSHEDVSCAKCHPKAKFNLERDKPAACGNSGCHNSPHDGHLFGTKNCEDCHSPMLRSLAKNRFNHAKATRFELTGAHAKQQCYACHTKPLGTRKPDRACATCHADDNRHQDRFKAFGSPPSCETCHPSSSWKPSVFNHDKSTSFNLTGKHAQAECRECHRGTTPAKFERFDPTLECMDCHRHKKAHDGEFKNNQCLTCHVDPGKVTITKRSVELYHGPKSGFPLVKKHKGVACEKCHLNDTYKDTPKECGTRCHEDWLHQGSLGDTCSRCHKGGEWNAVRFDHTDDTKWPLVGLHKTAAECSDCHPDRLFKGTPKECSASGCHAEDDVHEGKLGKDCQKCHQETGAVTFNHNTMSVFKLDGSHLMTKCSDCHKNIRYKPLDTECVSCHADDDIHQGGNGKLCQSCHNTDTWRDVKAFHDVGEFALKGAHDNQPCVRCHKDTRSLAGSGNLCINCHRQDDIHSNSLSPRCGECHTQWSFTPARFDHTTVGCNLTGLHRTLPCYECHKTGNFGGLSAQCIGCHRDTALKVGVVGGVDHSVLAVCAACHSPNSWVPGTVNGGYGRDSICR